MIPTGLFTRTKYNNKETNTEMKKIIVNGYTYETDLDVNIGDTVEFPTADWLRDVYGYSQEGVVTALESDYDGECVRILSVVSKKDDQ